MRRLAAVLLAALLLLCGCAEEETPDPGWEDYQPEILAEPDAPPEQEDTGPDYPAAFTMAYHRSGTLDPITCGEGIQQDVASLLFEPLFQLNAAFEPEPLLCESYAWDEAGLVCTLTLQSGVTFQDGSELGARDVVATLQRAAQSERYAYRLRNMASVAANRSGQVVITLRTPDQGLPALLDIPIVKRGTEDQQVPVGTGPYVLASGDDGSGCLQANSAWWQGRALPLETIPLGHAKDRDTAMYLFSTRKVELLTVDPTDDLTSVTGQSDITDRPTTILQYVGFNTGDGRLFANPILRSIFTNGIPRDTLVDAQLADLAVAAQFPISPLSNLYPAELETQYDKEKTLAALRSARQDSGEVRELTLLVNEEDSFRVTAARYIAQSLSLLDWKITVQALPWADYLAALQAGNFDLYFGEVRLTADWDLTDLVGTAGPLNYGGYSDVITDAALLAYLSAPDRKEAASALMSQLRLDVPIAPVCFKTYTVLTHTGVLENLSPTATTSFAGMDRWTVHTFS